MFYALQKWRASDANKLLMQWKRKSFDESWNSSSGGGGTTLHNDAELFVTLSPNTTYGLLFVPIVNEALGTAIDIQMAWTLPAGCAFTMGFIGAHQSYNSTAANVEVEFASWQNETGTTTSTITHGTTNAAKFGNIGVGSVTVTSAGGVLQFQWAQKNASASNLTVYSGSLLIAWPLPA